MDVFTFIWLCFWLHRSVNSRSLHFLYLHYLSPTGMHAKSFSWNSVHKKQEFLNIFIQQSRLCSLGGAWITASFQNASSNFWYSKLFSFYTAAFVEKLLIYCSICSLNVVFTFLTANQSKLIKQKFEKIKYRCQVSQTSKSKTLIWNNCHLLESMCNCW